MANNPSQNIPTSRSSPSEWIVWHKSLKQMFGKKEANKIWLYAWSKRGGIDNDANTNELSNYLEKNGIDIERSTLDSIGEGISDFSSGVFTFGKWMILIPLGIAGVVMIFILIQLFRNPNKTIGTAIALAPQGRALKGAKAMQGAKAMKSLPK